MQISTIHYLPISWAMCAGIPFDSAHADARQWIIDQSTDISGGEPVRIILGLLMALSIVTVASCRNTSAPTQSNVASGDQQAQASTPLFQVELEQEIQKLTPKQKQTLESAKAQAKAYANSLSEDQLATEMEAWTLRVYVAKEWADYVKQSGDNLTPATVKGLVQYAAIRERVDSQLPGIKKMVWDKWFARGKPYASAITFEQFLTKKKLQDIVSVYTTGAAMMALGAVMMAYSEPLNYRGYSHFYPTVSEAGLGFIGVGCALNFVGMYLQWENPM